MAGRSKAARRLNRDDAAGAASLAARGAVDHPPAPDRRPHVAEANDVHCGVSVQQHEVRFHPGRDAPLPLALSEAPGGRGGQACQDLTPIQPARAISSNSRRVSK